MKKLTMLLLACAMMALTNAAAVPEAEPEAVKEEASVQEAVPEAEPEAVKEEASVQEAVPEAEPEAVKEEASVQEAVPEAEPEAVKEEASVQEAAPEAEPVVEEPPVQEDAPEDELEELADESFLPEDLPEESEEVAMLENMEEDESLIQRSTFCGRGWSYYEGRCFIFIAAVVSWAQAERNCRAKDGHLASIHSYAEYRFIQQMIYRVTFGYPATWIGASDAQQEGHWIWSDGSYFLAAYWCPREPNNWRGQDCVQMNYGSSRCWADVRCTVSRPYVCAMDLW